MLDLGFTEILAVLAIAVLVIGPRELPQIMHAIGRVFRRLQYVRYAFSHQFEEFMREHDLDDVSQHVNFEMPDGADAFDEAGLDEDLAMDLPKDKKQDDGQEQSKE